MAKVKTKFKVKRQQIVDAAMSCLGWKFRHQARGEDNSVDCVGFLIVVGQKLGYPHIFDVASYRRTPSAEVIRETLNLNCDEIEISEVKKGDIYLMRIGGRKPRHAAIKISDDTDLIAGIEPGLIHAYGNEMSGGVVIEPVRQWKDNFVCGFRLRGLVN